MSTGSRGIISAVLDGKTSHKHLGTGHRSSLPVFKFPFDSGALFLWSVLASVQWFGGESVVHGLRNVNSWSPVGGAVWRGYGEVQLLLIYFLKKCLSGGRL